MAELRATLPADTAACLRAAIDQLAGRTRTTGDPRTIDQRRADALLTLADHSIIGLPSLHPHGNNNGSTGGTPTQAGQAAGGRQTDEATPHDTPAVNRAAAPLRVGVIAPLATLTGQADLPGELVGYGPIPPALVRELAGTEGTRWEKWITDPGGTNLAPLCRRHHRVDRMEPTPHQPEHPANQPNPHPTTSNRPRPGSGGGTRPLLNPEQAGPSTTARRSDSGPRRTRHGRTRRVRAGPGCRATLKITMGAAFTMSTKIPANRILTRSSGIRTASPPTVAALVNWMATIAGSLGQRSMKTPDTSPNTSQGAPPAAATTATPRGPAVRLKAISGNTIARSPSPSAELVQAAR